VIFNKFYLGDRKGVRIKGILAIHRVGGEGFG
jgi:hypothetical protein